MKYEVWPYAPLLNGWSITDDILAYIWSELVESGRAKKVFWAGGVETFQSFINFMQNDRNNPVVLMDSESGLPVAIAWLNGVEGKHALAHFAVLGEFDPQMGEAIHGYWGTFKNGNGRRIVEVLLGFIPETNKPAIGAVLKMGWHVIGTIPRLCELPYEGGKLVGGVVVYYDWGGN